ncbi:MAG: phytanoyl-CoA dioxygenase family protein [Alphaproteobacteria bacterium]|nr:phytanoyl-CoA dioxygenase family protein [Alphaproteobacteria bacterium]
MLTPQQIADFHRDGWLILRGALSPERVAELSAWIDEVDGWAARKGPGLHHFEQTAAGPRIARSEDWVPHHEGLRAFVAEGELLAQVGALFGEPAVLFKEKVNYKHPGGGGFAPHQDAAAYRFVDHHVSVMVPLDPANEASGGLYVAPGHQGGMMPLDAHGRVEASFAEGLDWRTAELEPGDLLFFDSYAPHKSGTNTTRRPRRALYLTYNAASKGDFRDTYYADKRAEMAREGGTFSGERVRISITDDFLGQPVSAAPPDLSELFARFEGERAHQMYDEAVTELEHALQSAELAAAEGAPDGLIAAALLHDVGHLLIGDLFPIEEDLPKDFKHEEVAARYLARWFGPEVTEPIRQHVAAKRYLVAVDPDYAATLSPSSVRSLGVQGGPMSPEEVADFEARPGWEAGVRLRRWDDLAKVAGAETRPIQGFHVLMRDLAARQAARG